MKKILFIVTSLIMFIAGCSAQSSADVTGSPASGGNSDGNAAKPIAYVATLQQQPISALDANFVRGINDFGFDAAGRLCGNDNLALSPVSIELALSMTRAGAAGQTAEDMKKALGFDGLSDAEIISACKLLMWRANTGGMEAADAIWVRESLNLSPYFAKTCTEDFMADAYPLVIPGAMDDINAWASDKTHGRIAKIISEELSDDTAMVLANALYFLGKWENPFKAEDTYDEQFTAPDGDATVPFMHSTRAVPYYQSDSFSMITLDFEGNEGEGQYAMAFLLPAEGSSPQELLASLSGDKFSQALSGSQSRETRISLPKFEFSYFSSLRDTLISMGMGVAFGGEADFSAMTEGSNSLYIDDVLHKCFVKVDELGAEAAAVTVVIMRESVVMPPENLAEFHADRPFVFVIYSQEDGAIAFAGAVNDPAQK